MNTAKPAERHLFGLPPGTADDPHSRTLVIARLLEEGNRNELAWLAAAMGREEIAAFVRLAVAAFVAEADDERWTQLISAAQGAEDAALAAISQILRSKLAPEPRRFTVIRRSAK